LDVEPVTLNGKRTKIYRSVVDFDAKSLYPSLINQGKIGKENQKYRIINIVDEYNRYLMSGQEFNEQLQTKDISIFSICKTLYGLPGIGEVLSDLEMLIYNRVGA
jgi:hypothetical protein